MSFYDILWHLPYDIKCHELCQYGYQKKRIDETNWSKAIRIIIQEQNLEKMANNWNIKISFVFLANSFVKCPFYKRTLWCWFLALNCWSNPCFVFTIQLRNFWDMFHKDRRKNDVFTPPYLTFSSLHPERYRKKRISRCHPRPWVCSF